MASKIFANTSASAKCVNLLNQEKVARLLDCGTGVEGLKILSELSYGETTIENPYDFEILIEREQSKHFEFLKDVSPCKHATACFMAELDFHNLKCAFKTKYGKIKGYEDIAYDFATINSASLLENVSNDEYRSFDKSMKLACEEIDSMHIANTLTPSKIDYICDKYMFASIIENLKMVSSEALKNYFIAKLDFTNAQTLLRAKLHEIDAQELKTMLFDGGVISVSSLVGQYDSSMDAIVEFYLYTKYNEVIKTLASEIAEGTSQIKFERERDAFLLNIFKSTKFSSKDADLFYGYIASRKFEFDNVRMIMVGLNNKLDKNKIKERLKELYV